MKDMASHLLIIGHRGASASAPENTLAAFRTAIDAGADGLEFDVRLARDDVPVVIHDATLNRTGRTNALVSDLTSKELGRIDVGSWFRLANRRNGNARHAAERVPTLAKTLDFLQEFPGLIFIELKCKDREVEPLTAAVCDVIKNSPLATQIIVKSFKLAVIPQVRMAAPGIRTAALFAPKIMTILRKEKHLVKIADELGADEISIHYSLATRKLMEKAGKQGLPVNVWTVDNPRWVKRGLRLGLRSIITNDPARLLARRAELADEKIG
jgi:glycerophosphoryl diester phosphodiesterase